MTWLIDTLMMTGVLILVVLVLRRPVARHFGPAVAYALWLLPMLRLILPPLVLPAPELPPETAVAPVFAVVPDAALSAGAAPQTLAGAWAPAIPVAALFQAVWLAGVLTYLAWRAAGYARMRRELLAGARPVGEAGAVRLVESPAASSPIAFGLRDKVVALPPGFMDSHDRAARDLAIAHELEHHAGRDLYVNIAVQPLLALHWFNPLAWLAWTALRRDQEAACDARVLAGCDSRTRAVYGRLIAGFAARRGPMPVHALAAPMVSRGLLVPFLGDKSIIHRLRSLTMSEPTLRRRILGRTLIAAGALALPLTATVTYAAGQAAEPPAPPLPPAPVAAPAAPDAPEPPAPPAAPKAHPQHRIVIVEREGGADPNDPKLRTRVVERDGRTIVFKSDKDLSEAEIEARIARAEASMKAAGVHALAIPEVRIDGEAIRRDVERSVRKSVYLADASRHHAMALADGRAVACASGKPVVASADAEASGRKEHVRVMVCNAADARRAAADARKAAADARKHALEGIRRARAGIAADPAMSDAVKREVLEELDAEIGKLSRES